MKVSNKSKESGNRLTKKSRGFKRNATTACTLALAVCAVATAAKFSANDVNAAQSRYQLVWSDEFNGTSLNTDNWNYDIGNGGSNVGWGNNELEYYTDREENVSVSNGTLKLTAREESYNGYAYTSGRIKTNDKQSFKYGKLEARMKLPAIKGVWPAFWMLGYHDKGWPYCGELDIMEAWNTANFAQGAYHWYNEKVGGHKYLYGQANSFMTQFSNFDKTKWHTYGVEWDSKQIKWLLDDKVFFTLDTTSSDKSEANAPYYFILNLAVGGNLPGCAPDKGTLPSTAEVDYVRAYQLTNSGSQYLNKWTEQDQVQKYSVKVTDGKKTYVNMSVYDGETVVVPKLTKKGYNFKGFYTKDGSKITTDTRIRKDTVAYAKWEKIKVPRAVISKVKPAKKVARLKCKYKGKTTGKVKGYQVKYSNNKKFKKAKSIVIEGKSVAVPRLKSGQVYYFKARAYKLDSKKKKVYGKWSNVKYTTIK